MLWKLYSAMEETAAEYKNLFDAAFAKYVEAEPGSDAVLFARLKVLAGKAK